MTLAELVEAHCLREVPGCYACSCGAEGVDDVPEWSQHVAAVIKAELGVTVVADSLPIAAARIARREAK